MAAKNENSDDLQQDLGESTICCICADNYKCPKMLPCMHTFCLNCIQETGIKTSKHHGDEMPCPICRQRFKIPFDGFTALNTNYYIEGLIRVSRLLDPSLAASISCDSCLEENPKEAGKDVPRADMYCCDCKQKLCEDCCRHHRKLKLTKNHRLISINRQRPTDEESMQSVVPSVCEVHKEEDLKIYCCACKTCVCYICFTENHEGHKGINVTKAADDFCKEIANSIEKVKTFISQAETKKLEIARSKGDVFKKLIISECYITSRTESFKRTADTHKTFLLEELTSTRQSLMKEIHIETDNVDAQLAKLNSYISYCEKVTTKGSACDICRSVGNLSGRVIELEGESEFLVERQLSLKPLPLFFVSTDFEEENEGNMIGQLTEQDHNHWKQNPNTRQRLIETLKKESEFLKAEITYSKTEIEALKLENEKLKEALKSEQQAKNVRRRKKELECDILIRKTLHPKATIIDKPAHQPKQPVGSISDTLFQTNREQLVVDGKQISGELTGNMEKPEPQQTSPHAISSLNSNNAENTQNKDQGTTQSSALSNIARFSYTKCRNLVQLECQQLKEEDESTLKTGVDDPTSENFKNPVVRKKRERILILRSQEVNMNQDVVKGVKNIDDTEDRHQLKKGDTTKNGTHKENVKQQTLYPSLPENSETQGDSINTNQKYKKIQKESSGVTNSGYSKGRDECNKDGKPQDVRYSENRQHQDFAGSVVKFSRILPDLRSGTSDLRSGTYKGRSVTSKGRSAT